LVPVLYGQTPTFLVEALNAYADGTRASGIMEPIAAELEADERQRVAAYYAGQALTVSASGVRTPATLVGESLAVKGRPGDGIPGCVACHGPEALPGYPRLAGQNAKYLAGQLQLWKRGGRSEGPLAEIMGPIARLLTAPEIDEVSAYFASLPVGSPR
jgi:cytochrome c553